MADKIRYIRFEFSGYPAPGHKKTLTHEWDAMTEDVELAVQVLNEELARRKRINEIPEKVS